jgi:hypothetical protein
MINKKKRIQFVNLIHIINGFILIFTFNKPILISGFS